MPAIIAIGAIYGLSGAAAAGAGIATVAAGAQAAASIYGAKKSADAAKEAAATNAGAQTTAAKLSTDAANHAADLGSQDNRAALDYTKQQAAQTQANFNATQRANYDQWAARQRAFGSLGDMVGLGPREIPGYVEPPNVLQPPPSTQPMGANAAATPLPRRTDAASVPNGDYQSWFQSLTGGKPLDQAGLLALQPQLQAAGVKVTDPSAAGIQSKIILPNGTAVRVLNGDTSVASPTVWLPQPGGGGSASAPYVPTASTLGGMVLPTPPPITGNLQIPKPGTLGYYAGIR